MDLTQLLAFTMQNEASDLHLSAGSPPIIRVSGLLKRVKADPLSSDDIRGSRPYKGYLGAGAAAL